MILQRDPRNWKIGINEAPPPPVIFLFIRGQELWEKNNLKELRFYLPTPASAFA